MGAGITGLGAQAGGYEIRADVLSGIQQASAQTGVDFSFLMAQAAKESGFDPNAKAGTSSASGLYQFVEQTWLSVVRKHGAEYGLGDLASKIKIADDGSLKVADRAVRKEILDLRRDPTISAAMAAEHAADNEERLDAKLDREVTPTDLYLAHFLGLKGAVNFLHAMESDPDQSAAAIAPRAAAANKAVFYNADGTPRSLKQIYDRFQSRIETEMAAYDDLNGVSPGQGKTLLADARSSGGFVAGDRAIYGSTNPGGILSPLMLVTLASLPTGRESDEKDGNSGSLFDKALVSPAA
ncbi:MAG TPA: transglycosylase SLT domain-containing protein [Alphaproteobacteria bacterium]|nr:transglycosylase SLT domain-containing protein [Alphaproteobacteria bacterium]